ncbi:MAG: PD-(D/E)XK nuclease family protein [Oscillospiraceae bacterium]
MTDFITGAACADVTGKLYDRIMQTIKDGRTATVIVPDQFVFETEKALYRRCADNGIIPRFQQIHVRTIARLSDEIVKKYSVEKPPADDITKSVVMYRAIRKRDVELSALGKISRKPGFASRMVKTVSLFKTAGIDCAKLQTFLAAEDCGINSSLLPKLRDICALYLEYDQILSQNYTDKLDVTMRAADLAARHSYFTGESVFVDGFNSFSGSQLMLMKAAAERADYACFSFVCDRNDKRNLFRTVLADIDRLSDGEGIPEPLTDNSRGMADGIRRASGSIFSNDTDDTADMSSVRIIRADDIYGEMDFIAAEIRRLVSEEGLKYNEIAVLCSDTNEYRSPAESAFAKYDIPMFCDIPAVILNAPLTNLIMSLLKALDEPSEENVLSYIRSSFLRVKCGEEETEFRALTFDEIDCFDGYIYRWQLKGNQFEQPFVTDKMSDEDSRQAQCAEQVRNAALTPLLSLREEIKSAGKEHSCTGDWLTERVCRFLYEEAGIEQAVLSDEADGAMLWDILVQIFEALHSALNGVEITIGEYYSLFRDICAETSLAKPPQLTDCVLLGDTGRTRAEGIKAAFIAGANYGRFPDESSSFGLFSDYEAELLSDSDLKIAMKQEEMYHFSRYQAYRAITLPTQRLYLTYPLLNTACEALSPSEAVTDLLSIFPALTVEYAGDMSRFGDEFYCRTRTALRSRYASLFGTKEAARRSTLERALELSGDGGYAQRMKQLVVSRPSAYRHRLTPDTAARLFRSNNVSATRLEKLNKCRFEYFCQNGLKIRERRTLNAANSEVGNAVHYVLERTLSEYCTKMKKFFALTREELYAISEKYLTEYAEENLGGSAYRSRSFNYMYNGLALSCTDLLNLLQNEFKSRKYRPVLFELRLKNGNSAPLPEIFEETTGVQQTFEDLLNEKEEVTEQDEQDILPLTTKSLNIPPLKLKINDHLTIAITGIVDRADMFHSEGGNDYLRIVDYKTGGHAFKLSNALYGVNTQMLIYLIALCDANPSVYPGGVSYLTAKMTDASSAPAGLMSLLASGHYPSGMCVLDDNTQNEMEQFAAGYARAILAGTDDKLNMKKLLPKEDAQPTPEQFRRLREEILTQTKDVIRRLYSGDVHAVPTIYTEEGKTGQQKSCTYCRYKNICGNQDKYGVLVDDSITRKKLGEVGTETETTGKSKNKKRKAGGKE